MKTRRSLREMALFLLVPVVLGSCDLVDALEGDCHIQEATNLLADYSRGCIGTHFILGSDLRVSLMSSEFETTAPDLSFSISGPFYVGRRGSSFMGFDSFESNGESGFADWVITGADETRFGERITIEVVDAQFFFRNTTSRLRFTYRSNL